MRDCFQTSDNTGADDTNYCHFWFRNWHHMETLLTTFNW